MNAPEGWDAAAASAMMARWYAAWNAGPHGDIDAIMACYGEGIEHSSPFIARFNAALGVADGADGTLRGKGQCGRTSGGR